MSADAFDTVHSAASKDLRALVKGIDEGRASLDRYASALEARTKAVEDIRIAAEILDTQWDEYERSGAGVPGGVGR